MRLSVSTMLLFPGTPMPDALAERLARRHDWVWLKSAYEVLADPANLLGPADFSAVAGRARRLHAINPAVRVGLYCGGFVPDSHHPHYEWLADEDTLHLPDGRPVWISPSRTPAEPGARRYRVPNYGRRETRAKLIARWADFLREHDLDGTFFDGFTPHHMAGWMRDTLGLGGWGGALEGPAHTAEWWAAGLSRFAADLRIRLAREGREVWANGIANDPWQPTDTADQITGRSYSAVVDYLDGLLAEHVHRAYATPEELSGTLAAFGLVDARLKRAFWFAQPDLLHHTDPGTLVTATPADLARYHLACYLLAQSARTTYGYHDREAYRGWDAAGAWYLYDGGADWERDYGDPVGPHRRRPDGLYERSYQRGLVLVNPLDRYVAVPLARSQRIWDPDVGGLLKIVPGDPDHAGFWCPPRWGAYLWPA